MDARGVGAGVAELSFDGSEGCSGEMLGIRRCHFHIVRGRLRPDDVGGVDENRSPAAFKREAMRSFRVFPGGGQLAALLLQLSAEDDEKRNQRIGKGVFSELVDELTRRAVGENIWITVDRQKDELPDRDHRADMHRREYEDRHRVDADDVTPG